MIKVLMATYNGAAFLPVQLDSLFQQSFQDWSLLVHDDNSTDETATIIRHYAKRYPEKITFLDDKISYHSASANFAFLLEQSDTDYIMLCDQDDFWLPEKIGKSIAKIREMETMHGADTPLLVFSDMRVVDRELNVLHESFWRYQKLDPQIAHDWERLLAQNVITGCTIIINRAARDVSLPFGIETMMHDHWIGVNVAKHGRIGYIDEPTVLYRQHGSNVEGAHRYGWQYVVRKIKSLRTPLQKLYWSAHFFGVPFGRVLMHKIAINIKRLWGRA